MVNTQIDSSGQFFGDAVELYLRVLKESKIAPKAQIDTAERHGRARAAEVMHYCLEAGLTELIEARIVITRAGLFWSKTMLGERIKLSGREIKVGAAKMELLS